MKNFRLNLLAFAAAVAIVACGLACDPAQAQTNNFPHATLTYTNAPGGLLIAENVTAAAVIKASSGSIVRIIVISPGTTSGSLTINDATTTAGATTANEIFTIGYAGLSVGQVITVEARCQNGIVVSAVPGGGSPQYVITYT